MVYDGKTLSPRPSSWASREAREARSARFQESEIELMDEIEQLIRVKTASPTYALKRFATVSPDLNDVYRGRLLETAKVAIEVAYAEYERARTTGWKSLQGDIAFSWMSWIPFCEIRDFQKYVKGVNTAAEELVDSTMGFEFFEQAGLDCRCAKESVGKATDCIIVNDIVVDVVKVQMAEIGWMIERKCIYWAAAAMMDARIEEAGRAGVSGEVNELSSESP